VKRLEKDLSHKDAMIHELNMETNLFENQKANF
jgi:hypothetical protein